MKMVTDISRWQSGLTNKQWNTIKEVFDGVVIRLSHGSKVDTWAEKHIQKCKELDLPYSGYHFIYPWVPGQVERILQSIRDFEPASMFIDVEDYRDQDDSIMPSWELDIVHETIISRVRELVTIPIGVYSADWYINKYSPQMKEWIYKENYWEALYLRYTDPDYLEDLYKYNGKPIPTDKLRFVAKFAWSYDNPHKAIARQFDSFIPTIGLPEHLDLNAFSDEGFERMFAKEEPNPMEEMMQNRFTKPSWNLIHKIKRMVK